MVHNVKWPFMVVIVASVQFAVEGWLDLVKDSRLRHAVPHWHREVRSGDMRGTCVHKEATPWSRHLLEILLNNGVASARWSIK